MHKVSLYFLLFIPTLSGTMSFAQGKIQGREIAGFSHPESVCQAGNFLFVSNIGKEMEPTKKDGDGFISKVDLSTGKVLDYHFLPASETLNAPKGMALNGNTLYVADIDHIAGFDIDSRKKVFDLPVAGTGFLNDLVWGNGKLYASATDNGKIYEIDPVKNTCQALPLKDSIAGANGLYYNENSHTLFCVSLGAWGKWDGRILAIDLEKMTFQKISDYEGMLDGVDQAGGTLYFSDWKGMDKKGSVFSLDPATGQTKELVVVPGGIAGPADFIVSNDKQYFIIPALLEGKVYIKKIEGE